MTTQISEYSATEAALSDLAARYKGVVYDVTTKEGLAAAKSGRNELRGYRTSLEAKRVEIKAPALERCRLIDAEAKRITAELEALENPIAAQIKIEEDRIAAEKEAKEAAERQKIEAIHAGINAIRQKPVEVFSFDAEHTQRELDLLQALVVDEAAFGIFRAEAQQVKDASIAQLTSMLETKRLQEAEALRLKAEREALEKKQAEQAEQEAEQNRRREAEEREKKEALQASISEIQGIQQQVMIASVGRAGVRRGGSRECIVATLEETEAWIVTPEKFGEMYQTAQQAKDGAVAQIKQLLSDFDAQEQLRAERLAREEEERKENAARAEREAAERAEREAEEERKREIQRKENLKLDGREMLTAFTEQFGQVEEFAGVVKAIDQYFATLKAAA